MQIAICKTEFYIYGLPALSLFSAFSVCPENNRRYDPGSKGSPSNDFQNSHALKNRLRNLGIVPM